MFRSTLLTLSLAFAVTTMVGCGSSGPEMGDVTGTVTYKGKPLPTGTITFIPEEDGIPRASAEVQEDGTFQAETSGVGSGVPVGKHRVMISAFIDMGPEAPVKSILPDKYGSDRQSGLTAEVTPGENIVNFSL
ncbi:hypothetical protein ACYFX5_20525 [Bremerella sp. T1]|uniref:hypothetical protein n=1 Tax=Bremerella sp. TYQ1 TaxID=3119568 RepID=UPI001CCDFFD4|nr:hypothetical protein [Bremerella volcania]UBM35428.1 hypothetical protein LA756_22465 [Bremerella volcania]